MVSAFPAEVEVSVRWRFLCVSLGGLDGGDGAVMFLTVKKRHTFRSVPTDVVYLCGIDSVGTELVTIFNNRIV